LAVLQGRNFGKMLMRIATSECGGGQPDSGIASDLGHDWQLGCGHFESVEPKDQSAQDDRSHTQGGYPTPAAAPSIFHRCHSILVGHILWWTKIRLAARSVWIE
jgi:hypothetical protein